MSGFPDSSVGKESSCNAGDPSSITGSGRAPGEGIGYPLQYPWASLVAQLVKNPPAMWETGVLPWVGKIPWRKERYPPQYSVLKNSIDCIVHGVAKSQDTTEQLSLHCLSTRSDNSVTLVKAPIPLGLCFLFYKIGEVQHMNSKDSSSIKTA